jgi:CRISPR-associated protein Cmr2
VGYLFSLQLGPVQGFIASARRSRDLWFGSKVLSELARAGAKIIADKKGKDSLIFPSPDQANLFASSNAPDVANKILAFIQHTPVDWKQDAKALGKEVKEAVQKRLEELYKDAFTRIKGSFDQPTAEKQLNDLLEVYWAAVELNDLAQYGRERKRVEALLEARKTTRDFKPVSWGSSAYKSSLDGQRESVIRDVQTNGKKTQDLSEDDLYKSYGTRSGELLCGVGFFKRHGERQNAPGFCSTSHMAAMPLFERMEKIDVPARDKERAVQSFTRYLEYVGEDRLEKTSMPSHSVFDKYDGRILYKERLDEFVSLGSRANAQSELSTFLGVIAGGAQPNPYYAFVLADGDRMGAAFDLLSKESNSMEKHRLLSASLGDFADEVRRIVKEQRGCLVYAGGDDVMAYVPLHRVLECTKQLKDAFNKIIKKFEQDSGVAFVREGKNKNCPTLSAGVLVVHHLEPLSDALEWLRHTEKAAKNQFGRNALAVTLAKRGGVSTTIGGQWDEIDTRLEQFITLFRDKAVPSKAAFDLRELAWFYQGKEKLDDTERDMLRLEAERILKRKGAEEGILTVLLDEFKKMLEQSWGDKPIQNPVMEFSQELVVARELAKAVMLANPEPEVNRAAA